MSVTYYDIPKISGMEGLTSNEIKEINELISIWWAKRERNVLRNKYYEAHNTLKDLGISIPPPLKKTASIVGWPELAVDKMAERCILEGFTFRGDKSNSLIEETIVENDFISTYQQGVTDALISSCAFITVTKGRVGEPDVIVSVHSARDAAALWDYRLNRIKAGIVVADFYTDDEGRIKAPKIIQYFTGGEVIEISRDQRGNYALDSRQTHSQGAPLMECIRYSPKLGRPFGKSRVSRAVMAITDSAVRESLRSEVTAEFFTAPQKYILGCDDDIFEEKSKWEAYIGNFFALGVNEEGENPQVGQFAQGSMQPHTDYMRSLAARFAGETCIPVSELGVIHDNPSSAEAIYAAKEGLVIKAQNFARDNRASLSRVGKLILAIGQDKTVQSLSEVEKSIMPRWINPAVPSIASQTDAIIKQVAAFPWMVESRVAIEQLGYTDEQIERLLSDKRRYQATQTVTSMLAATRTDNQAQLTQVERPVNEGETDAIES